MRLCSGGRCCSGLRDPAPDERAPPGDNGSFYIKPPKRTGVVLGYAPLREREIEREFAAWLRRSNDSRGFGQVRNSTTAYSDLRVLIGSTCTTDRAGR
jgi:hypothetical protein